jgi:hypothetical protein
MFGLKVDLGARGDKHGHVRAVSAVPLGSFAVPSPLGFVYLLILKMQERVDTIGTLDINAAAVAAVAAARTASGDKLLPPERHAAIPSVPGNHMDLRTIDKHVGGTASAKKKDPRRGPGDKSD